MISLQGNDLYISSLAAFFYLLISVPLDNSVIALAVAQNQHTPIPILRKLLNKANNVTSFKEAVIKNLLQRNSKIAFAMIAKNINFSQPFFTRLLLFLNPHTPSAFLVKNFRSSAWLERYAIAQNPNTPINTLKYLTQDGNSVVRAAAKANLQQQS